MNEDAIIACAHLVGRAGATEFELGHTGDDDTPDDQVTWYAHAKYRGARIQTAEHRTPTAAANALTERLLSGATCRCGKPVTLSDRKRGCRWRLVGPQWQPGCDAAPLKVQGERGDVAAMQAALAKRRAGGS